MRLGRSFPLFGLLAVLCACCPYAGSPFRSLRTAHAGEPKDARQAAKTASRGDVRGADPVVVDTSSAEGLAAPTETRRGARKSNAVAQGETREPNQAESRARSSRLSLPSGRDIAALSPRECRRLLTRSGVQFESVSDRAAANIAEPVSLLSPLGGVSFGPKNGNATHGMLDCRLALALLAWAPSLQSSGVIKVEHYSTYRPGAKVRASRKTSGHARAMAIDAARFHLRDGTVLAVDSDWDQRERGGDPCLERRREADKGKLLRRLVCDAVEQGLFQVVITPHHDRAHQDHVHLELVPEVDWTYIH